MTTRKMTAAALTLGLAAATAPAALLAQDADTMQTESATTYGLSGDMTAGNNGDDMDTAADGDAGTLAPEAIAEGSTVDDDRTNPDIDFTQDDSGRTFDPDAGNRIADDQYGTDDADPAQGMDGQTDMAQDDAGTAGTVTTYDDGEIETFAMAVIRIAEIRNEFAARIQATQSQDEQRVLVQEANEAMRAAIEDMDGLTVEEYLQIAEAASTDPELTTRIGETIQTMQQ